ncbi:glycosyltransferase family 39 protein, partial [Candidatus Saccharibacteria bacterium]|nr:glycosyltransferase family 39 protein [Candidatus Saccharibacteria bacterium]
KYILDFFGVTNFSIKFFSLVCAFITGIGAVFLLRRWYRPNIAVLTAIIMITTGQFLFIAQSGTASITYVMWPVWLLLAATMITSSNTHKRFWKVMFFILMALSLYTPLSIYLVLAIVSAAILHPHVRHVLRRMSMPHLSGLLVMSIVIAAPLGYLIYLRPELALQLLGAPSLWPPDLMANAGVVIQQYFNFISPKSGTLMTPVLGLGSIALIGLGAWQLFKTRYTARSYTLTAWAILLIPVLLINPIYTSITFVPFLLLAASGLNLLLRSWYGMFPLNPYARIAGLLPLIILVTGLVISGVDRYIYGYHYDPNTAKSFSRDLTLLNYQVRGSEPTKLMVTETERPFYEAIAQYNRGVPLSITTRIPQSGNFTATKAAHTKVTSQMVNRIVTTGYTNDADRYYIYKNSGE